MTFPRRLAALAFAFLVPIAVFAAAQEGDSKSIDGQVTAVDAQAKTVAVKVTTEGATSTKEIRLVVDQQTSIMKDGQAITLNDLKQGDKVVVSYKTAGGKSVAVTIGVQPKQG